MNLQAELAYIQARLSTLQRLSMAAQQPSPPPLSTPAPAIQGEIGSSILELISTGFNPLQVPPPSATEALNRSYSMAVLDETEVQGDLQALAREFVCRYLPGVRFRP